MVLGTLIAIIAAPGLLGSQEAIRQSQSKEKREEHRARRCNLIATCVKSSLRSREINGRPIVLRNGRLWIDTGIEDGSALGHPYAGYYLPYPDSNHEGLVTTITDVAPIMNWVYVDRETHEVRYGVRADAQPNLTGPFDCTRQDRRLTFDGWEGWCAVEEIPGLWALYFDVNDDGLSSKVAPGTRVLDIELSRKEKRFRKEAEARQQDQTTKRAVDASEDAPVDQPLGPEALEQRPGVKDVAPEPNEGDEAEEPKSLPFRMPISIFENPPPLLQSSIFKRPPTPGTPPPAYSTTARPVTPANPSKNSTDVSPARSAAGLKQAGSSSSTLEPTPKSEKRTTPKINRSSGTRAIAQAQMFEALAAGKKTPGSNTRRTSRASSNADSVSQYSGDGAEETIVARPGTKPNALTSSMLASLATLTAKPTPSKKPTDKASIVNSASESKKPLPPRPQRSSTPPRQKSPTASADPAVFNIAPKLTRAQTQSRRPPPSRGSPPPRAPSTRKAPTPSSPSPAPLRRQATAPVSSPSQRTPQGARDFGRTSLASTMSSGRGNQAMRNRVGSASSARGGSPVLNGRATTVREGAKTAGRKTTSALFREIDELVSQESTPQKKDEGGGRGSKQKAGMRDR